MDPKQELTNFIINQGISYTDIEDENSFKKIYNLFINNIIFEASTVIENRYLGFYYHKIKIDYDLMKKCYLIAINGNNHQSMHNLGHYYHITEKNYDLAKKYYLMAIDNGNVHSLNNLGAYYNEIEKNNDLAKKYYLMAIDKDNINSVGNLIKFYNNSNLPIEKLEFFIKYKNKIERNKIIDCINRMANINLNKEDNKKFIDIIINFEFKDEDNVLSIIKVLIETIKYKISITKLHFEYNLEGKGFKEAEEDFYNKII
jgi:hypothetical protein